MADLKLDLTNKINNDKYYAELELVRLASEPNIKYLYKVEEMSKMLDIIANANNKIHLIENVYFNENNQNKQQPSASNVITHVE